MRKYEVWVNGNCIEEYDSKKDAFRRFDEAMKDEDTEYASVMRSEVVRTKLYSKVRINR